VGWGSAGGGLRGTDLVEDLHGEVGEDSHCWVWEEIGWEETVTGVTQRCQSKCIDWGCGRYVDIGLVSLAHDRMLIGYDHHVTPGRSRLPSMYCGILHSDVENFWTLRVESSWWLDLGSMICSFNELQRCGAVRPEQAPLTSEIKHLRRLHDVNGHMQDSKATHPHSP
jgi:hypothetical protein